MEENLGVFLNVGQVMSELEARNLNPLSLAYIGDAVYELFIRTMIFRNLPPNKLNKEAKKYVAAYAQAEFAEKIMDILDDDELYILKRGRNKKQNTVAKNQSIGDYKIATGVETLFGYLYITGKHERMLELIERGLDYEG